MQKRLPGGRALAVLPLVLAIVACDPLGRSDNRELLRNQLTQQEARWNQNGSADYTVVMSRICVCPDSEEDSYQVELVVQNNQLVSGHYVGDRALTTQELAEEYTLTGLFALARDALNRRVAGIAIAYNQEYSYIEELFINYDARTSSDDILIRVDDYIPVAVE